MKKIINQESKFDLNEMFISLTDPHGKILSGNEVFTRVSGYTREQLIGQPHNVIRHPDMPKAVFKLFWETISQGQVISAYVKNRSIDGKYYWVFASVLPCKAGYLSIRIKPTSGILSQVEALYQKMKMAESLPHGIEESTKILLEGLKSLGFSNYTDFYRRALNIEMESRKNLLKNQISEQSQNNVVQFRSSSNPLFEEIQAYCEATYWSFRQTITELSQFENIGKALSEKTELIIKACERLEYLSLNMSVTANKFGKEGASLTSVSGAFQRAAKEIAERFLGLGKDALSVSDFISKTLAELQLSFIQIEMLAFYAKETSFNMEMQGNFDPKKIEQCLKDTMIIGENVKIFFEKALQEQSEGIQTLRLFSGLTESLKNVVMSLDLIRLGGRLEGSRNLATEEAFNPYVAEMQRFISIVEKPIHEIANISVKLTEVILNVHEVLERVSSTLMKIEMLKYRNTNQREKWVKSI